jgi:hypothetical protein
MRKLSYRSVLYRLTLAVAVGIIFIGVRSEARACPFESLRVGRGHSVAVVGPLFSGSTVATKDR